MRNCSLQAFSLFPTVFSKDLYCGCVKTRACKWQNCLLVQIQNNCRQQINPLPDMPILGSSNSAVNKDMIAKIWTNGDTVIWLSRKHCGKRRNCSLWEISPFPTMFSKASCCWCVKTGISGVVDNNFKLDENGRKFFKQVENTVGKGEIARYEQFLIFPVFSKDLYCGCIKTRACKWQNCLLVQIQNNCRQQINPLPDMPILGSSNSAVNKDMIAKIWTNGDTVIWLSRKHCGKRRNCSLWEISPFPTMFSKASCCWCVKTRYL